MGLISIYESEVSCLYSILDLQRQCMNENIGLTPETNKHLLYLTLDKLGPSVAQKVVSKLVAQGEIKWKDEEDFEVEQILDCVEENGVEFYHIKWRGWSHAHNTWEPKHNLECPDLMEEFHRKNRHMSEESRTDLKRKFDEIKDTKDDRVLKKTKTDVKDAKEVKSFRRTRIDELFQKLVSCNENLTPLNLISQTSPDKKTRLFKGFANTQVPKFNNASKKLLNPKTKAYKEAKVLITNALKDWEKYLNKICSDTAPIIVENNVDLEGPPENFRYINDYKPGPGIVIPDDPVVGCECTDCYSEKGSCCAVQFGVDFAYFKWKRLRIHAGRPIYECNKKCLCGTDCPNRVVQQGRKHKVCVFRTSNGRGWGVKALQKIKSGTFVMEYVGEVISSEEAEIRGKTYDAVGRTYLFDLDFNGDDCPFTVDAAVYGNVSHFVNHSCDPNMEVYSVWINTLDTRLPRIALFSRRDIEKGEELTFDYMSCKVHSPLEESHEEPHVAEVPASGNVQEKVETIDQDHQHVGQGDNNEGQELEVKGEELEVKGEVSEVKVTESEGQASATAPKVESSVENSTGGENKDKYYRMMCQCGAKNCRRFVF